MDKVRLGRALGYGTRHAAKTLMAVAEAAAAPDPSPTQPAQSRPSLAEDTADQRSAKSRIPPRGVVRGAGRSVWAPLATFSSALWLRVTGLFFAMMASVMATGAWRARRPAALTGQPAQLWLFAGLAFAFTYFAVSSFVRAGLRERQ